MKNQATDYLTKPFAVEELLGKIQEALGRRLIERGALPPSLEKKHSHPWLRKIIGASPMIQAAVNLACQVARTNANVLIVGEAAPARSFSRASSITSAGATRRFLSRSIASASPEPAGKRDVRL